QDSQQVNPEAIDVLDLVFVPRWRDTRFVRSLERVNLLQSPYIPLLTELSFRPFLANAPVIPLFGAAPPGPHHHYSQLRWDTKLVHPPARFETLGGLLHLAVGPSWIFPLTFNPLEFVVLPIYIVTT